MGDTIEGSLQKPRTKFEYRFQRNADKHSQEVDIRTNLTELFAETLSFGKIKNLELYPVARAGKSGSEVFYLDVFIEGIEFPKNFIAKFQNIDKTKEELDSAKSAEFASICSSVVAKYDDRNDLGIVVYNLAKVDNHTEFRGYFLDISNSDEDCSKALNSIFKKIGKHPNDSREPKKFIDDYSWYLKRSDQPISRIDSFKEGSTNYDGVSTLAKSIAGHYELISKLLSDNNTIAYPYLVHGDLHARNLMLSENDSTQTELIDFGWTHYGHPAKDFSLMEITLKYMLLHEFLKNSGFPDGESQHPPLKVFEGFESYLCAHVFDLPEVKEFEKYISKYEKIKDHHIKALKRVYISIREIRIAAKSILLDHCIERAKDRHVSPEKHFLISNFLMTLGLSGFDEVQSVWALVGLDIVGKSICQK